MSLGGTMSGQQTLSSSMAQRTSSKPDLNLFQKIQILSNELQVVGCQLQHLNEECQSIKQQKDAVEKYLQGKSEQNRVRLFQQLQEYQFQLKRKVDTTRAETLKIDNQINQVKQTQLYTLQMILSLQRRVQELQVQLGLQQDIE